MTQVSFFMEFDSGNAAFDDNAQEEAARIVRDVADKIQKGDEGGPCMDVNGNNVGGWELVIDEDEPDKD